MTANEAQTLIRYTGWASRKILEAVQNLPEDDRGRGTGISHHSIEKTVGHIYLADRAWYRRATGVNAPLVWETTWEETQAAWPELLVKWQEWADALTDEDAERVVHYRLSNGDPGQSLVSQIVTHVVNHATLHRGQVMGMIRQLGVAPPPTDILWFYREQGNKV